MTTLFIPVSFRKIRRATFANKRPRRRNNTVDIGVGDFGCNNLLRMVQFRKQTKEPSALAVLLHADTNELQKFENEVAKFIPRGRIFGIHVNMLHGNGNGKDPSECVKNFPNWSNSIDAIISKLVKKKIARGAWNAVYHVGCGGSAPAIVYVMEKLNQYFYRKFVIMGEPRDEASSSNKIELLTRLAAFDNSYKILYANNREDGTLGEVLDFANVAVEGAITSGCEGFDIIDFTGRNGLSKFSKINCRLTSVPYYRKLLFFGEQDYERTLETCVQLFSSLDTKKKERIILCGDVREEIANLAIKNSYGLGTPVLHRKFIDVSIEEWNVVAGRVRKFTPRLSTTMNYDKLKNLMNEKAVKEEEAND